MCQKTKSCLFGVKSLYETMLTYHQLGALEQISMKLEWKINYLAIFIQDNEFENTICTMAAILSRPRCKCNNQMWGT